jgi:hypothetical protein
MDNDSSIISIFPATLSLSGLLDFVCRRNVFVLEWLQGWSPPTYTNDTIKSTTDAQPLSLHESTTPVQRINVISPPHSRIQHDAS